MARTPVRLAPEWDARFAGGIGVSLLLHGLVIAGLVLLAPLAAHRAAPLGAYTVELTDPSALGGRLPPGPIKGEVGGGQTAGSSRAAGRAQGAPAGAPRRRGGEGGAAGAAQAGDQGRAASPAARRGDETAGATRAQARAQTHAAPEGGARGQARREGEAEARAAAARAPARTEAADGEAAGRCTPGRGRGGDQARAEAAGSGGRAGEARGVRAGRRERPGGERRRRQGRLRARRRALEGARRWRPRRSGGRHGTDRRGRRGTGRRRAGRGPRIPRLPAAGHQHHQEPVDQRDQPAGARRARALRHRARRHGERRAPRAELGQSRLRQLGRPRGRAREPAAAAAGALRRAVPRVRDRVPLRGAGRSRDGMRGRVVAFVLTFGLVAAPARAVVTGEIYGPGSESFRIAVSPLKDLGGGGTLGAEFARILSRDLELSGYFKLLDPKTFVEDPQTSGFTAWAAIGAQALVKGGVSAHGPGVTVEVRLFDVPARKDVPQVGRRFTGGRADVPRMAHKTADAILAYLTGEPGPFDSAIAFVSNRGGRLKDIYLLTFDREDPVRLTDERSIV